MTHQEPATNTAIVAPSHSVEAERGVLGALIRDPDKIGAVSGMLGDFMSAATTVKVNDAVEPTMVRLRQLVDARRATAVRWAPRAAKGQSAAGKVGETTVTLAASAAQALDLMLALKAPTAHVWRLQAHLRVRRRQTEPGVLT